MQAQKTLIDKAAKICGSDAELCRRAQISPALLSLMRSGKRAMTPVTAAVLADIAGEDARTTALDAVVESAKGTRLEHAIREILGKGLAAGVAAMLAISYSSDSRSATELIASNAQQTSLPIHRIYYALRRAAMAVQIRVRQILPRKRGPLPPASADLSRWSATRIVHQARMAVAPR